MNLDNLIYLIFYVLLYSFLGWVLESVYKTIYTRKPVNSGFLMGPLCPIYGVGALIMYLFLDAFKDNIALLFGMGFLVLSAWEFLAGFILEKIFKTKYWDYSSSKFNIQGRVCLKNSLIWGGLGVFFTTVLHPVMQKYVEQIPTNILMYIEIVAGIILIADIIVSAIKVANINVGVDKLVEITESMKAKMDELKALPGKANEKSRESVRQLIEELKQKEENIKASISKNSKRFMLAFPSMRVEKISKILNKKIDILEILKNDKK